LIYLGGRGYPYPVDVPTEKGKVLAAKYREAIADTAYYHQYFDDDVAQVPREAILEFINLGCLCQVQKAEAPDRPLLLDTFLHGGPPEAAADRRATFRLLLDLINQTVDSPLNQDVFRQLIYFQAAHKGSTYTPRDGVRSVAREWRLYQAREYYAFALNGFFRYLCHWGQDTGGDIRPKRMDEVWSHLEDALDFATLARRFELAEPQLNSQSSFSALLGWLRSLVPTAGLDTPYDVSAPLHEHKLVMQADQHDTADVLVAGMMTMMGLIYNRFGDPTLRDEPEWRIARMGENGRLSMNRFLTQLRRLLRGGDVTIMEVTRWLFRDYVLIQHQAFANAKLPDNTFRFQREGNYLRFYRQSAPLGFTNSRFEALTMTLHELGLCGDVAQIPHTLSNDGQKLLDEGDIA
ncbi:MAG: hypothetical protein KDE51_24940, partial [Anaerolineales bacterium]|nr:hypothetical protein [Anaerolineales bacterium]